MPFADTIPYLTSNDQGQILVTATLFGTPDLGLGPIPDYGGAEVMYIARFDTP